MQSVLGGEVIAFHFCGLSKKKKKKKKKGVNEAPWCVGRFNRRWHRRQWASPHAPLHRARIRSSVEQQWLRRRRRQRRRRLGRRSAIFSIAKFRRSAAAEWKLRRKPRSVRL